VSHLSYKTISANKETANKEWLLVDAADQPLGRVASKIASLIRGKHKVNFTPHVDCGDNVVVINAEKIIGPIIVGPGIFNLTATYHPK